MHKFQRNTLSLMLIILLVVCSLLPSRFFFRTLPKNVLPADQLAPQPQDINGYPGPPCPKPPATPGALCQFHSKFHSANPLLPKFIPNSRRIISPQTPFPPLSLLHRLPFIYSLIPTFITLSSYLMSCPIYLMLLILNLMFIIPLIYVSFNKLNYQPY